MDAVLFTPDELHDATDTDLDHALTRLYGIHLRADDDERADVHTHIVAVLDEQARRLDGWLSQTGGGGQR